MGSFDNAIPRGVVPQSYEGSRLHSPREPGGAMHDWKRTEAANRRNDAVTRSLSQIQRQIAKLGKPTNAITHFHPFKIYQFPSFMRYFHPTDEAYRLKVRSGCVNQLMYSQSATSPVAGTDFENNYAGAGFPMPEDWEIYTAVGHGLTPPSDSSNFVIGNWSEVTVPQDGNLYYFWVSALGGGTAEFSSYAGSDDYILCFGTNGSGNATEMWGGTTGTVFWPTFPNDDPYHMLVGVVTVQPQLGDTSGTPQLLIYQVARTDWNIGFGIHGDGSAETSIPVTTRFRGTYDSSAYYFVGDIVTQVVNYGNPPNLINTYIMYPPAGTSYQIWLGPIHNVDPSLNSPDPWCQMGQSISGNDGILANGSYDSSKYYLRNT